MIHKDFIEGMRRIAYPVCIVSACANENNLAITVSSVTSVSVDPPSLLVCINKSSSMARAISNKSLINVNFLNYSQRDLAEICADKDRADTRFSNDAWLYDSNGSPYLDKCEMVAFCEVDSFVSQGTHFVAFLSVKKVNMSDVNRLNPLVYQNRSYVNIKDKE